LFQVFNGNFVASTRLMFAFGRRGTLHPAFANVHSQYRTPTVAILGVSAATLVGLFLGDAILVPVTEVGSLASSFGWFAACLSFLLLEKSTPLRLISALGILVSLAFILMKIVPSIPGHFSVAEWIALAIWLFLGFILHRWPRTASP
jgi:amino acid transporter